MKKINMLAAVAVLCAAAAVSCGQEEEKKLVLYTPTSEANLAVLLPKFTADTGIEVEYVYGSGGDIRAKTQAEVGAPQGDVIWQNSSYIDEDAAELDAYEKYVSKNDKQKPEKFRSKGYSNITNFTCPVIIWNDKMVNGTINGYNDVLAHPEVKGLIAMGDATASNSAYDHIQNMVLALGTGKTSTEKINSTAPWTYIENLYKMLDKKIIKSSSQSLTGVVSGEYAVGYSWDTKGYEAMQKKLAGDADYQNVNVCFMNEGVVASTSGVAIFKGCAHPKNAKIFVDWICGEAGQAVLGKDIAGTNPISITAELAPWKNKISDLNAIELPADMYAQKNDVLAKLSPIHQKYTA